MLLAGTSPLNVYAYTGTIGTFGYMTSYLLMAIGMPVFLSQRGERRGIHLAAAGATAAAMLYIVYKNFVPVPPSPFNILPYVYAAILLAGLAWFLVLRVRHPERAALVGTYDEEMPPARTTHT